jgi:hypothetical protein
MAILASAAVTRARYILNDTSGSGVRWKDEEMLLWVNEARRIMANVKPTIFGASTYVEHTLVAGNKQRITTTNAYKIDSINSNKTSGKAIRPIARQQLDSFRSAWANDTADDVQNWFSDETDPLAFWVYPAPSSASIGAKLNTHIWITPDDLSALNQTALPFDQYEPALVNFILARAFAKEDEAGAAEKSAAYLQLFNAALA